MEKTITFDSDADNFRVHDLIVNYSEVNVDYVWGSILRSERLFSAAAAVHLILHNFRIVADDPPIGSGLGINWFKFTK